MSLKPKDGNKVFKIRQIQEFEIVVYVEASDWDDAEEQIDQDSFDCFPHDYQCVNHETVAYDILDEYPEECTYWLELQKHENSKKESSNGSV